jgi:hypothetical protein
MVGAVKTQILKKKSGPSSRTRLDVQGHCILPAQAASSVDAKISAVYSAIRCERMFILPMSNERSTSGRFN